MKQITLIVLLTLFEVSLTDDKASLTEHTYGR